MKKFSDLLKQPTPYEIMKFTEKHAGNKFILPKNPHLSQQPPKP